MNWEIVYSRQVLKDARKIAESGLKEKVVVILAILAADPFRNHPPFEKLVGDLTDACSRRINIQQRLVYQVFEKEKTVRILRMWTHYE